MNPNAGVRLIISPEWGKDSARSAKGKEENKSMKEAIHPAYHQVRVHCACGNEWETRSTNAGEVIRLEICSQCHPFFTGKQKLIDTAGRVERFQRKYAKKG